MINIYQEAETAKSLLKPGLKDIPSSRGGWTNLCVLRQDHSSSGLRPGFFPPAGETNLQTPDGL
jgi:hypothetical protein